MSAAVQPDILRGFPQLFGARTIQGRHLHVERLIAQLTRSTRSTFEQVLSARHSQPCRTAGYAAHRFLASDVVVCDADDVSATVGSIRQGMLDGFFGRATSLAWQVNSDIPLEVTVAGLEGTGPAIDLGMAMGALNSGAVSWMWDWEDAGGDFGDQLYQAWRNLKELLSGEWTGRPFIHPTKTDTLEDGTAVARRYAITTDRTGWPTIFHRVPGLHLRSRHITVDDVAVPAIIPALVIHALNNFESQVARGSGIYFYVPKLEHWQEARLVGTLLRQIEHAMGVRRGRLKVKVLNERGEFVLQQEVIHWVLRTNLIGPNVGRWDYLNSRQEMFRRDPAMVIPDPHTISMTEASMTHYTRRNALLAILTGAMPIGGMSAQMQNPRAPENDHIALRNIWFDKLRERLTGLFILNGRLYDAYRQSWVATIAPDYVIAGREPLVAGFDELQGVVDRATSQERALLESLGLLHDGRVSPLCLSCEQLTEEALFAESELTRLFARPDGPTTEDGLRYAMHMATEFMYQQLQGNNAAAIDDPNTGLRFMNDLATYEIFWHFLYLAVFHGVPLTADGRYTKRGDRVTPALFDRLLDERREVVRRHFTRAGRDYDSTHAELVLQVLRRQVVTEGPTGALVPQDRWINYGSRVLLSLIERGPEERSAILDAIFTPRPALLRHLNAANSPVALEIATLALKAHDYVYDVFASAQTQSLNHPMEKA